MPWGEPAPINWKARAEKAEAELVALKITLAHRRYTLTSTISGEEVLGSILLEDDRLWQQLNDGFGVMLAPVMNPVTHGLRWINAFRPRQEMNEWCNYYPPKDKVDPAMAIALASEFMEATDGIDASSEGSTEST